MLRVVLTGGLCGGKSTVAAMLRERGWAIVEADAIGHEMLRPGSEAAAEVEAAFGTLDRQRLAERVFADEAARRRLNGLLHPRIRAAVEARLMELDRAGTAAAAVEIPLFFEEGAQGRYDRVIAVICDREIRLQRCVARSSMTRVQAESRLASQWPDAEKAARADYVIDTSGTLESCRRQVEEICAALSV